MKKSLLLLVLFLSCILCTYAKPHSDKITEKITLPTLLIQDSEIELVVNSVNNYIMRKKDGWMWPVSKIVFSKKEDIIHIDIIGIDNSWANLFEANEFSIGYFILGNRMFVVSTQDYEPNDLEKYFYKEEATRVFSKPDLQSKATNKPNPVWHYKFVDGTMIVTGYEGL